MKKSSRPGPAGGRLAWIVPLLWAVGCTPSPPAAPDVKEPVVQLPAPPPGPVSSTSADASPPTLGSQDTVAEKPPTEKVPAKPAAAPAPLFQNWPQPQYALFITGMQYGYIEPCGCTGLVNQKGGLSRRFTCWKELTGRGWDVIPLDAGNQVRRFGRQSEIKFQMTVEGLKQMRYRAIAFGPDDLRLSVGELVALTASDDKQQSPFVCANTSLLDTTLTPQYQIIKTAAGKLIGVTAVISEKEQARINSDEIVKLPPAKALAAVWPKLKSQNCDTYVLMTYATAEEARQLAQQFPDFDVVIAAGDPGEPTFEAEPIPNTKALLVQVGNKAMHVCVIGVFDGKPRLRYQRVPLDGRYADARPMLDVLASYQQQLKAVGLDGLGVKPLPHPSTRKFVGSKACQECHEEDYDIWKKSKHAKALDTLVKPGERSDIPRHFDPECLSCHVVGWNPQKYFPYQSGYVSREESPLLGGVGCENCHGPSSAHVEAENGDAGDVTDETLEKLRAELRLPLAQAERKCLECHDIDNSYDFHLEGAFEKYWKKVEHPAP